MKISVRSMLFPAQHEVDVYTTQSARQGRMIRAITACMLVAGQYMFLPLLSHKLAAEGFRTRMTSQTRLLQCTSHAAASADILTIREEDCPFFPDRDRLSQPGGDV